MSNPYEVYWLCSDTHNTWRSMVYGGDNLHKAQLSLKAALEDERPEKAIKLCMDVNKLS